MMNAARRAIKEIEQSVPRQRIDQAVGLLLGVVEVRRGSQSSFAQRDFDLPFLPEPFYKLVVIVFWRCEADDPAPLIAAARADDVVALYDQAADQSIRQ